MARSRDAPMDFEFTSRPSSNVQPAWAQGSSDSPITTPKKRDHATVQLDSQRPPLTPLHNPFSQTPTANMPFLFQSPLTPIAGSPQWQPPLNFSPEKAFDIKDVDMADASPPPAQGTGDNATKRKVAMGAVRRVYNSRSRHAKSKSTLALVHAGSISNSEEEEDDEDEIIAGSSNHNHYTLNMLGGVMGAGHGAPEAKGVPDVMLGCVSTPSSYYNY